MSSSRAPSLRDTYNNPSKSWSFVPVLNDNGAGPSTSNSASPSEPSYQWSSRPRTNSIYELSPGLSLEPTGPNAVAFLRASAASAFLLFVSCAIETPWEVGKTLLQVQYVPRDASAVEDIEVVSEEDEAASEDELSTENEDGYFADEDGSTSRANTPRPTDDRGYIIRQSVSDNATRPDYVIPLGSVNGVWPMIKQVARWKPEGWLALWKGLGTSFLHNFISTLIQPAIQSALSSTTNSIYRPSSPLAFSRQQQILIPVASHFLTEFFLSPLSLIRTRLIVQTSVTRHQRYSGPIDAFLQIMQQEGGIHGMYLHPQLFFPTLLECTISPLVDVCAPRLTARMLATSLGFKANTRISDESHPFLWAFAQLAGSCAGLLITLPLEVVRRRLQVQSRGTATPITTCVEVRRRPYYGVVDTIYSILAEERSDLPLRPRKRHARGHERKHSRAGKDRAGTVASAVSSEEEEIEQKSWLRNTGIGQLYRGLGMRVGANVIIFVLSLFVPTQDSDEGWTEL